MISVQAQPTPEAGVQPAPAAGLLSSSFSGSITCPGLFYPTLAPDGLLLRLRFPGGLLNASQCRSLASLSERLGSAAVDVTNRANIQIRGLAAEAWQQQVGAMAAELAAAGLAAPLSGVDHLRNIMASPTAGIDPTQLLDTRPLVKALDAYISSEPELAGLSPKFSVGLDGGEQLSIAQQPNDLQFRAVAVAGQVYFQLDLREIHSNCDGLIRPAAVVEVVAAIAQLYRRSVDPALVRKPRLRQVLQAERGQLPALLQPHLRQSIAAMPSVPPAHLGYQPGYQPEYQPEHRHLGVQPQRQPEQIYFGVALRLGRLTADQLRQLANLAETYGSGSIRLTPWRNLLLSDIARASLPALQQHLVMLGLNADPVWGGLVACSGLTGCAAAATDTQADAAALAARLASLTLPEPLTIHFSGCPKSCAHRIDSDLALVGDPEQATPSYSLYVGADMGAGEGFGRWVAANLTPAELPSKIANLLAAYNQHRATHQPCRELAFPEFVAQQSVAQLQLWLSGGSR